MFTYKATVNGNEERNDSDDLRVNMPWMDCSYYYTRRFLPLRPIYGVQLPRM
jgi:hypothetical protein